MKSNLQIINLDNLNGVANGDEEFKQELMGIFHSQIPVFVKNLRELHDQNNLKKLAREAHTAKSSAMIFGMERTGNLLKEIEIRADKLNAQGIADALNQIIIDLNLAIIDLENLLDKD